MDDWAATTYACTHRDPVSNMHVNSSSNPGVHNEGRSPKVDMLINSWQRVTRAEAMRAPSRTYHEGHPTSYHATQHEPALAKARRRMASTTSSLARSQEQVLKKPSAEPNVLNVVLGNLLIKPWYPSFYPEDLVGRKVDRLYVCHWCFRYSKELMPYLAHMVGRTD